VTTFVFSTTKVYHGVPAVAETDQRTRFLSGRKMMSNEVHSKLKAKGLTTCVVGNCNNHEEVLKVKQKQHKVGKRNINGHSSMSGLVPLNADYYVPRPHPPKNN